MSKLPSKMRTSYRDVQLNNIVFIDKVKGDIGSEMLVDVFYPVLQATSEPSYLKNLAHTERVSMKCLASIHISLLRSVYSGAYNSVHQHLPRHQNNQSEKVWRYTASPLNLAKSSGLSEAIWRPTISTKIAWRSWSSDMCLKASLIVFYRWARSPMSLSLTFALLSYQL